MAAKKGKRKYSKGSQEEVKNEMHRYKRGTAHSGKGHAQVKSKKQAVAIALSKARKKGKKAPKKATGKSKAKGKSKSSSKSKSRSKSKSKSRSKKS